MRTPIPLSLLEQVPEYVRASKEMEHYQGLLDTIGELAKQSAVLAIREWFEDHPDFNAPFNILVDTPDGVLVMHPVRSSHLSSDQMRELHKMCDMLYPHANYYAWPVVNHAIMLLNALSWDRRILDNMLRQVLDQHTKIGGVRLFALVDAEKLNARTARAEGQEVAARL